MERPAKFTVKEPTAHIQCRGAHVVLPRQLRNRHPVMPHWFLHRSYFREENFVGVIVEEDFKRWTAKRKAALVT